ncbi:MAG: hypothetical protein U0625_05710 [Phycisphaerales bacterium]
MKTEQSNPNKLASFLKKHGGTAGHPLEPVTPDLVELFIHSYLLWQAPSDEANAALGRIKEAYIDWNELRVSLVSDLVDVIGSKYWRAAERMTRLRDAMNGVFRREHRVSLERLKGLMKKDAVSYMETLPGMVPFVANRVLLVGVDFHAVPLEEFGLQLLTQAGALPPGTGLADAAGWLTRHVKAEEARDAHRALVAAIDHMWATNPPRSPKASTKPSELAPPQPVEEAKAAARALVEAQLAAERAAVAAERAARREEARQQKAALKAKEARDAAKEAAKSAKGAAKTLKKGAKPAAPRPGARVAKVERKGSSKK